MFLLSHEKEKHFVFFGLKLEYFEVAIYCISQNKAINIEINCIVDSEVIQKRPRKVVTEDKTSRAGLAVKQIDKLCSTSAKEKAKAAAGEYFFIIFRGGLLHVNTVPAS